MQHHIIPQFYLRCFRDPTVNDEYEPSVWVVDLQENTVRLKSPKKIAKATDYYAFPGTDGGVEQQIETKVLAAIESAAAPVITLIRDGHFSLTDDQRTELAVFVSMLVTRTPSWREGQETQAGEAMAALMRVSARHPKYFARKMREAWKDRTLSEEEIEKVRRSFLDPDAFEIRAAPTFSLDMMLKIAMAFAPMIFDMEWLFVIAALGTHFITSDNPVFWLDPTAPPPFDRGLANKNTVLSFPLGPEVALVARWKEHHRPSRHASEAVVRSMNDSLVRTAARHIFAARREEAEAALALRRDMEQRGELVGPRHGKIAILEDESEDPS